MKNTRKRILDILTNKDQITARELSHALSITQADVRHHLGNMIDEGLILITGVKRDGRRGRPARYYSLASSAEEENFDLLSSALLNAALEDADQQTKNLFLRQVAAKLTGEFNPHGPLVPRLVEAVSRMNSLGYEARWEAHADAPHLILARCPFEKLYSRHPELNELDKYLVEYLLDEQVARITTPSLLEQNLSMFQIGSHTTRQAAKD
jgi:predicted ArsR family transcriptional regulator